jgi:hypothetical protein
MPLRLKTLAGASAFAPIASETSNGAERTIFAAKANAIMRIQPTYSGSFQSTSRFGHRDGMTERRRAGKREPPVSDA